MSALTDEIRGAIIAELIPLAGEVRALRHVVEGLRNAAPSHLVSVVDAASRAGVSVATMRRWVASGDVQVVRRGRTVRVDVSSLSPASKEAVAAAVAKVRDR
jgi:hypothetical protein